MKVNNPSWKISKSINVLSVINALLSGFWSGFVSIVYAIICFLIVGGIVSTCFAGDPIMREDFLILVLLL